MDKHLLCLLFCWLFLLLHLSMHHEGQGQLPEEKAKELLKTLGLKDWKESELMT